MRSWSEFFQHLHWNLNETRTANGEKLNFVPYIGFAAFTCTGNDVEPTTDVSDVDEKIPKSFSQVTFENLIDREILVCVFTKNMNHWVSCV
jgi:hypothetical protein